MSSELGLDGLLRVCDCLTRAALVLSLFPWRFFYIHCAMLMEVCSPTCVFQFINDLEMTMVVEEVLARGEQFFNDCAHSDNIPGMHPNHPMTPRRLVGH